MIRTILYEVAVGENVPEGLPQLILPVLSPVWEGPALHLTYPDGELETVVGWCGQGPGGPCEVRVFWTRHKPGGPPVCLAIGGDGGLKNLGDPVAGTLPRGRPFLALAAKMIPPEVLAAIGPPPAPEVTRLLLG